MKWTEEEVLYLKENYPKNIPLSEIANKVHKTKKAIKHKASREEVSRPRFPSANPGIREPRKIIDKRYYDQNKKEIYKRRQERINKLKEKLKMKLGGKCSKCGYHKCFNALEFHHNKGEKEENISVLIRNFSKEKALKEVDKCIILCANCHREVHSKGP